jgi:hypothetical protein
VYLDLHATPARILQNPFFNIWSSIYLRPYVHICYATYLCIRSLNRLASCGIRARFLGDADVHCSFRHHMLTGSDFSTPIRSRSSHAPVHNCFDAPIMCVIILSRVFYQFDTSTIAEDLCTYDLRLGRKLARV